MAQVGIDVGSVNTALALMERDGLLSYLIVSTDEFLINPQRVMDQALENAGLDRGRIESITATGRGRKGLEFAQKKSAEVVCQAKGAAWLFPSAGTVLNLGAESSRVISLDETGRVKTFAANDKCAAGSGLFFDSMSHLLEVPLEEMGPLSLKAESAEAVSSRCAVFAESEVISHIHRGVPRERILAGLHQAVIDRILDLTSKVTVRPEMVVTGGVAGNPAIIDALEARLGLNLLIPPEPRITGAIGAALISI